MSMLANHWAAAGHDVALATFEGPQSDFFDLDPAVRRYVLGETAPSGVQWLAANRRRMGALRAAIRESRPDVVLSFLYTMNLLAIVAARGQAPVVVSERIDPRYIRIERWQAMLRRVLYPRAAAVVVQTEAVLSGWAPAVARGTPAYAIPNPVLPPAGPERAGPPERGPVVVSAGRLEQRKGFDVLIAAFARLAGAHPEWSLIIMGEGDERPALTRQAEAEGVGDRVRLPGTGDARALFLRADIFGAPSRLEGFPNALLEAMASSLPVVATDCPSGPGEMVRDGIDGYLVAVDDVGGFARALERLMDDEQLRLVCGRRAAEVTQRFGIESVAGKWERVFAAVQDRAQPCA